MKKIIRLNESDLIKLVKKVISEGNVDCLKDFKISSGQKFGYGRFYNYKEAENKDGIIIEWDFQKNDWSNEYRKYLQNNNKREVGKWKCENGRFITYDSEITINTYD